MEINYLGSFSYLDSIEIENIGDFSLECENDNGYYFYMIAKTLAGLTSIFTWGPVIPDVNLIPEIEKGNKSNTAFEFILSRIKWNEKKIKNFIWSFLNNRTKKISKVKLISEKEALAQIKDMEKYITNFGEDSY